MGAGIGRPGSSVVIPFPAQSAGLLTGWVELDADALRADDRRYFVATIAPPPTVTLTGAAPFIADALAVLSDAGRIRTPTAAANVLIAPAGAGTEGAGTRGVVIVPPETALELPATNRRLAALGINWRYESAAPGEARFLRRGNDELERSLANVRVLQSYRLLPAARNPRDSVLLRLQDGSAWAVQGERARGGRFVLLASPLTPAASTLPTSVAMIPLIDRATGIWVAPAAARAEARPGELMSLPSGATTIVNPDGTRDTVRAGQPHHAGTQPGAYRVLQGGSMIAAYVVNPPAVESLLRRASDERIARALPGWKVEFADDADSWDDEIFDRRLGYEFWRLLVIVLLVVLAVEAIVAATGRVQTAAAAARET